MTIMDEKLTIMVHKTDGVNSTIYYVSNLPEWWELR